ncbi:MAG: hypothetical protein ACI4XR_04495 [Bacilli bacterium]
MSQEVVTNVVRKCTKSVVIIFISAIIYLVDLIKQLWEYNFSNMSKVIAPFEDNLRTN